MRIDVWADIVCPWCFIGQTRLEQVAGTSGATIVHRPFILDPSIPPDGRNIHEVLRRRYGDLRRAWDRVEASARSSGLELDLSKQPMSYPTAPAHTLLRQALERGTQRPLVLALYRAYFIDRRNLGDPDVLAEIAAAHGFEPDEARRIVTDEGELAATRELARQASEAGIGGVPFFVFDRKVAVSGAQPPEVLRQAMERVSGGPPPPYSAAR